ncbi:MAG: ATP-binding protein [Oscillospiraceae bacterium]|nr:ATP-binding protein [Oscillospiraceae bacterium]
MPVKKILSFQKAKNLPALLVMLVFSVFFVMFISSYIFVSGIMAQHMRKETENTLTSIEQQHMADHRELVTMMGFVTETVQSMMVSEFMVDEARIPRINNYISNITGFSKDIGQTSGLNGFTIYYTETDFMYHGLNQEPPEGYDPTIQPWYMISQNIGHALGSTSPYTDEFTGKMTITLIQNIFNHDDDIIAILLLDVLLEQMYNNLDPLESDGIYWFLMDRELNGVVHPDESLIGANMHDLGDDLYDAANDLESGAAISERTIVSYDGEKRILWARQFANGFYGGVIVEPRAYLRPLYELSWYLGGIGVVLALMLSAILVKIAKQRLKAEAQSITLLESMPLGTTLWRKNAPKDRYEPLSANYEMLKLFETSSAVLFESFELFSPEFQPDGASSTEKQLAMMNKAMEEGHISFEWMHQTEHGDPLPCEITLTRTQIGEDIFVAGYARDMRDEKALLDKIKSEHKKIEKLAHWYQTVLDAIPLPVFVISSDMKFSFVNSFAAEFLEIERDEMIDNNCNIVNLSVCNTDQCFVKCAQRGVNKTYFKYKDLSLIITIKELIDLEGKKAGFIDIWQDITEVENMAKKNADIEAANNAKSLFLATVSHEIRTPMNTILGISEIQLQNDDLPTEVEDAFTQICYAGDLLLNIINDILDLTKIESGKLEVVPVRYDIPSLIYDTVQLNHLRYESKPINLKITVDKDTPLEFFGDDFRIRQVLNNLLSNSYKYTDKGEIEMTVFAQELTFAQDKYGADTMLILKVRDTGQGLTEEQISKLFDEFTRFNPDLNTTVVGTGLGMSITKRLVDVMNGEISVESQPNVGSVFTVKIPQKRIGDEVCGEEFTDKLKDYSFRNRARAKKLQSREYMPYGSVLVVDDVSSNLQVAKGMLMPYGLEIELVPSGFEAIDKVEQGKVYDIIFMDHMMPKMDGIMTTQILREKGYQNPIVALTANALVGQAEMFMKNKFDGFISKPIDSREMNTILNEFIRNRKPDEVVEEARALQKQMQEQQRMLKAAAIKQDPAVTTELEKCFVWDAGNAIPILEDICACPKDSLDKADIESYIIVVHGMKSALVNIGEKEMAKDALKLEHAGKIRDYAIIEEFTPSFLKAIKGLVDRYTPKSADSGSVASCEKTFLKEKLEEFIKACEGFNKKAAKTALKELNAKSWDSEISSALNEIDRALLHSAFKSASQKARELIKY